jgi:hypothetical protein
MSSTAPYRSARSAFRAGVGLSGLSMIMTIITITTGFRGASG